MTHRDYTINGSAAAVGFALRAGLRSRRPSSAWAALLLLLLVVGRRDLASTAYSQPALGALLESSEVEAGDDAARLIAQLTVENAELAQRRSSADGPAARAEGARREAERLELDRKQLQQRFQHVRDVGDWTDAIGLLLQRYAEELPDVDYHRTRIRQRRAQVAEVRRELLNLQVQATDLRDLSGEVSKRLNSSVPMFGEEQRAETATQIEGLLRQRRDLIEPLARDYQDLLDALVLQLGRSEDDLIRQTLEFREYINERILWIPSMPVVSAADGPGAWHTLRQLLSPAAWMGVWEILAADVQRQPMPYAVLLMVMIATAATRRKMRRRMQRLGQRLAEGEPPTIASMIESMLTTVALAIPWSVMLWIVGSRCRWALDASSLTQSLGVGLQAAAIAIFNLELLRQVSRKHGLAAAHFHVDDQTARRWRRDLWALMVLGTSIAAIVALVQHFEASTPRPALTRLLFIAAMILLALVGFRVLRPSYGLLPRREAGESPNWLSTAIGWSRPLAVALPLALAFAAALGYIFAAERLFWHLQLSIWLIEAIWISEAVIRRSIALMHGRRAPVDTAGDTAAQSRRLLGSLGVLVFAVGCYWIWLDVLPALRVLDQWQLWSYTPTTAVATSSAPSTTPGDAITALPVTALKMGDVLLAIIVLVMTSIAGRNLPGLLDLVWFQRLPIDAGARYALVSLSQYLIVLIGGVWVFRVLGVSWTNVQWLVAAVSVGLGFGLQEIFANFVSGLIVLFERPIRVGDIVTIEGVSGTVTRIRARATSITDWDRKELIVPNKVFITGKLVNWTLSDSVLRVVVKAGIPYGADTAKAVEVLLKVAGDNPHLLKHPPPQAVFTAFGNNAIEFELRGFVAGPDRIVPATHRLYMEIERALREAGMAIPFHTSDVHIQTFPAEIPPIEIRMTPPK